MKTANLRGCSPAPTGELRLPEHVDLRDKHGSLIRKVSRSQALEILAHPKAAAVGRKRVEYIRIDLDYTRGARASTTTFGNRDSAKQHHPRCDDWGAQNSRKSEAYPTT